MTLRGKHLDALLLAWLLAALTAAGYDFQKFYALMTSRTGLMLLAVFLILVAIKVGKRVFARLGPGGAELEIEKNGDDDA